MEYTEGVTKSNGVTTIVLNDDNIDTLTLYYYCQTHPGMGSDIISEMAIPLNLDIPSFSSVEDTISYSVNSANNFVEFIQVAIELDKEIPKDIGLHLISPEGTEMSILHPFTNVSGPADGYFYIGVSGFYGEQINGNWTLKVTDYTNNGDSGTLIDWAIRIYGN